MPIVPSGDVFTSKLELKKHITSVHYEKCEVCMKIFRSKIELKKHTDNVHIFEENNLTLEDIGVTQIPEIMPRIKQNINIEDLDDDSDGDADFENQGSLITPPPRDASTRSQKFNKKNKIDDEELLHEESIFITPRPPTPPAEEQTKRHFNSFQVL